MAEQQSSKIQDSRGHYVDLNRERVNKEPSGGILGILRQLREQSQTRVALLAMVASGLMTEAGCNRGKEPASSDQITTVSRTMDDNAILDNQDEDWVSENKVSSEPESEIDIPTGGNDPLTRTVVAGAQGNFVPNNLNTICTFTFEKRQYEIIQTRASAADPKDANTFYIRPQLFISGLELMEVLNSKHVTPDGSNLFRFSAYVLPQEIKEAAVARLAQEMPDRQLKPDNIAFVPPQYVTLALNPELGLELVDLRYSAGVLEVTVKGETESFRQFIDWPRMSVDYSMHGFELQRNQAEVALDLVFKEILSKHTNGAAYNVRWANSSIESGTVGGGFPLFCHAAKSTQTFKHAQGSESQVSRDQKLEIMKALSARAIGRIQMENGTPEERQQLIDFVAKQLEELIAIVPAFYNEATGELQIDENIVKDLAADLVTKMKSSADGKAILKDAVDFEIPKQLKVEAKMESTLEGKSEAEVESQSTTPKTVYLALFHEGEFSQHIQAQLQIDSLSALNNKETVNAVCLNKPKLARRFFKADPEMISHSSTIEDIDRFSRGQGLNAQAIVDQDQTTEGLVMDGRNIGFWVKWTLKEPMNFTGIRFQGPAQNRFNEADTEFRVEYSDDGKFWQTALDSIVVAGNGETFSETLEDWNSVGAHSHWRIVKTNLSGVRISASIPGTKHEVITHDIATLNGINGIDFIFTEVAD